MRKSTTQVRWTAIASELREAIETGQLIPGQRLPSETEMAAQWNISPVTAHRAMQELQREGWVTRKRKAGTVVAERPAQTEIKRHIALVFGHWGDRLISSYGVGVRDALPDHVRLIPYDSRFAARHERACLEQIEAEQTTDGLVLCPTCAPENTPLLVHLAGKYPLVFVDRIPVGFDRAEVRWDAVMTDNFGSMRAGMQLLHARGHRRIAYFMSDVASISSAHERFEAYAHELKEQGISDSPWVREILTALPHQDYYEQVEKYLAELLSGTEPITAICCQQDQTMAAVLEACVHLRVSVPEQLEIFSFCDSDPTVLPLARSVHRCQQRTYELGSMAARRLMLRMENPDLPSQTMRLLADLHPASKRGSRASTESQNLPEAFVDEARKAPLAVR